MDSSFSRMASLFFIILIIMNVILTESTQSSNMCISSTCQRAAADILEKMDTSVDPCDNFYKFTCGQFLNSTFTTPDEKKVSWRSDIREDTLRKLGGLLNSKVSDNDIELFRHTKQLYKQCLDRKNITAQQDKIVLDILNRFGGWPVVQGDNWNSTDIDWTKTPAIFSYAEFSTCEGYFLTLNLVENDKNSNITFLDVGPIYNSYQSTYPVKNFTNYSDDSVYYNFLMKYAVKLGAEKDRAEKEIMEAMKFESDLLNISMEGYNEVPNPLSPSYNFMTIDEMMKKWPKIDWLTYINSVFSILSNTEKINKNETVAMNYPIFATNFEKLISSTPKRILINYAFGRIIIDLLKQSNLGSEEFLENKQLKMNDENDWKDCVEQTVNHLPDIVTALYVRNFIRDDAKLEAMNITSNIKMEFVKKINETNWLDIETKNNTINKILAAKGDIGYPDFYRNDKDITEMFCDLQLGESTYLHNVWKICRFNAAFTLRGIRQKYGHIQTRIPTFDSWIPVNAGYSAPSNTLTVSPNFLQRPIIDKRQPSYMNYGGIGNIISHELGHMFDTYRNFIDKNKITKNLLIKSSVDNFEKRIDCLIDQYNNYTVEGTKINLGGIRYRKENIADNVGVRMSYYAYINWSSQHDPELILPGLNYTHLQMFWISYASTTCDLINPDYLNRILKTDTHAPFQYRVLGSFSNIPEFSKDFNCPLGSPMNPKNKCTIF